MKKRSDRVLLILTLVFLVLWAVLVLTWDRGWSLYEMMEEGTLSWGVYTVLNDLRGFLLMLLPVGIFFCAQLLCCGRAALWLRLLPTIASGAVTAFCAVRTFTATGWDGLAWFIYMAFAALTLAGCALAWIVFGIGRWRKRRAERRHTDGEEL